MNSPIVFFDIGGTLMEGPDLSPPSRFGEKLQLSPADIEFIRNFIFTQNITDVDELVKRFRDHFPHLPSADEKIIRQIWQLQHDEGYVIPGAFEVIREIVSAGYRMGIISNIWYPSFARFRKLFADYLHLFQVLIVSFQVGVAKPDPEIFARALKAFNYWEQGSRYIFESKLFQAAEASNINYRKQETGFMAACMIGDSYRSDIAPAQKMGFRTVWITRNVSREAKYIEQIRQKNLKNADITINSIDELKEENFEKFRYLMDTGNKK